MFERMLNDRNQAMFNAALKMFCNELEITKEQQNSIKFNIVDRLRGASGNCAATYHAPSNKMIKLEVNIVQYGGTLGMVECLAHELVHVKQHLRGEFGYKQIEKPFFYFWKIKKWARFHGGQELEVTPYFEQLCEQEAYKVSFDLMLKFTAKINERLLEEIAKEKEAITVTEHEK